MIKMNEVYVQWVSSLKIGDRVVIIRGAAFCSLPTKVVDVEYGIVQVDGYPDLRFVEGIAYINNDAYRIREPTVAESAGELR